MNRAGRGIRYEAAGNPDAELLQGGEEGYNLSEYARRCGIEVKTESESSNVWEGRDKSGAVECARVDLAAESQVELTNAHKIRRNVIINVVVWMMLVSHRMDAANMFHEIAARGHT
jgi:hypothetical protein